MQSVRKPYLNPVSHCRILYGCGLCACRRISAPVALKNTRPPDIRSPHCNRGLRHPAHHYSQRVGLYVRRPCPFVFTTNYLLLPILSGPAVALPLFALWFVSGGKWIGLGDAKLALGIGWLLGPLQGLQALLLAFIIGAIVGLGLIALSSLRSKAFLDRFTPMSVSRKLALRFTMKSEIPFGPFLIAACMFQWFTLMYNIPIPFLWQ